MQLQIEYFSYWSDAAERIRQWSKMNIKLCVHREEIFIAAKNLIFSIKLNINHILQYKIVCSATFLTDLYCKRQVFLTRLTESVSFLNNLAHTKITPRKTFFDSSVIKS